MKQLSVFGTLPCVHEAQHCRYLFSNTSYNQGKRSNKFTYLNFMTDDPCQLATESLLTEDGRVPASYSPVAS